MKTMLAFLVLAELSALLAMAEVNVPSAIDHGTYDRLLKKYVDERGLVAYQAWKNSSEDYAALKNYLAQFAPRGTPAEGNEKIASLINAYNAFVLEWILQKYPTESIQSFKDSFSGKRYSVGGQTVSLDDIEQGTLRPEYSYRTHSVLVCAARSCPPLQRSAYSAANLEQQDDHAYQVWLGRGDLNEFKPNENKVEISNIFKWFKSDFDKAGGVPKILARYGPESDRQFLSGTGYRIDIKAYNWGLNDQGEHGRHYTSGNLYFDKIF
jgi:hypothetical protein